MIFDENELNEWCQNIKNCGLTIDSAFGIDNETYVCINPKPENILSDIFINKESAEAWFLNLMPRSLLLKVINKELVFSCGSILFNSIHGDKTTIGYIANLRRFIK